MASKSKPGIKYFSQDSDHVQNTKVKLLYNEFDSHGPWIWECLKCAIYANKGYYFDMNDHDGVTLFASDVCKKQVSLVKEVINGCLRRGLLDQSVFDAFGILTSDRIQSNWLDGTREKRKKDSGILKMYREFILVEFGANEKRLEIISINDPDYRETIENYREKTSFYRENVDKRNEMKLNEKKGERKSDPDVFRPPSVEEAEAFFEEKKSLKNWNSEKCKTEALAFVSFYGRTGWLIKGDPIVNWQNAAAGWMLRDDQFQKTGSKKEEEFPDHFDWDYSAKLTTQVRKKYLEHLKGLGWRQDGYGKNGLSKWVKY